MPHMSLTDFVVFPPGDGRSVTDFSGWDLDSLVLSFLLSGMLTWITAVDGKGYDYEATSGRGRKLKPQLRFLSKCSPSRAM